MLCPKCQKENLEGAKFCAFCGNVFSDLIKSQGSLEESWKKERKWKIFMIIKIMAAAVWPIFAFMLIFLFDQPHVSILEQIARAIFIIAVLTYPIILIVSFFKKEKKWKIAPLINIILVLIIIIFAFIAETLEYNNWTREQKKEATAELMSLKDQMKNNPDIFWDGGNRIIYIKVDDIYGIKGKTTYITSPIGDWGNFGKISKDSRLIVVDYDPVGNAVKKSYFFEGIKIDELNKFKNRDGKSILEIYPFDPNNSTSNGNWFSAEELKEMQKKLNEKN